MKPIKSAGFTLIELLITVSVVALISGLLIPNLGGYTKTQKLKQAQSQILADVRLARSRALANTNYEPGAQYWVVTLTAASNTYTLATTSATSLPEACETTTLRATKQFPKGIVSRYSTCVLYAFKNAGASFYYYGTTPVTPKSLTVDYLGSSSTSCYGVRLNEAGSVYGDNNVPC